MKLTFYKDSSSFIRMVPVIMLIAFLSACSMKVKLVGQYDEITDKSVHQLQAKTTSHINLIISNKGKSEGSYKETKEFYSKVKGEIQSLIVRSEVLEDGLSRTPMTDNFKALSMQYEDLALLHQTPYNKKVIKSAQAALDQSYRAIVKHLIFLKWNQEQHQK